MAAKSEYTREAEGLEKSRQALVDAWIVAINDVCGHATDPVDLRALLEGCLQDILEVLRGDASPMQTGFDVGRSLARMACRRSELLGYTQQLLYDHLFVELSDAQTAPLRHVLASLLGGMARGFLAEPDAVAPTLSDRLEEARRSERHYYTTILNMIDALIVVVDASGYIVGFNGVAERVSGYTLDDVFGRHYTFLQAPESYVQSAALIERLKSLPPDHNTHLAIKTILLTPDEKRREIEWSVTAVFDDDGALDYIIGTGNDITASRHMERELAKAHQQVAQAKEVERVRLAQDLHDDAVQQLLGISYQVAEMHTRALEEGVWSPSQRLEELAPGLEMVREEIVGVAQGLRRLISSLRPPAMGEMGLAEILEIYVVEWQDGVGHDGPAVQLDIASLLDQQLPEAVATCIFRLMQEGIWNAHKHAAATEVTVIVRYNNDHILVRIKDNGQGFRIPRHLFQFAAAGRFGLLGMQERVRAVGGLFSVWSQPGQGTEIQAHLPLWR